MLSARAARRSASTQSFSSPPPSATATRRTLTPRVVTKVVERWRCLPLAVHLASITTLLLATGIVIAAGVTTSLLSSHLVSQVDTQLISTAQAIANEQLRSLSSDTSKQPLISDYYVFVQYTDGDRYALISTEAQEAYGTPIIEPIDLDSVIAQTELSPYTVNSSLLGRTWRAVTLAVRQKNSTRIIGSVTVALPLSNALETVERTRAVVGICGIAVVLAGGIAAIFLVGRTLRPLREIEGVAGRIATGDLSARVRVSEPPTTEVGSLQRSINAMLTQIEQAFDVRLVAQQRMQRFVSDASHELRTPLAAIRGYGELFRMGGVPAERTGEVMGRIESEATRMGRLVEDLLQLARMDEGRALDLAPVNVTDLAAAALGDLAVLAPERDTEVIDLDGTSEAHPVIVEADRDRLSQVITNLLSNVVRYTPEGTSVEIAVGHEGTHGVIEVRDHGPGVPEQDMEKVFERFYRADTSRTRETGGSGLGLAIVATIINLHGGQVRMLTTEGGGATVRITLPLAT